MREEIATRLKEARLAAQFRSAADAATSLGVKYATYAGHENATRAFAIEDAILYARRFKVSLDWLLTGHGRGPGGSSVEAKITDEAQILSMLSRIEGLSDSDINVAFGVIRLALTKQGGSAPAEQNDQSAPANPHHVAVPSR